VQGLVGGFGQIHAGGEQGGQGCRQGVASAYKNGFDAFKFFMARRL
jgi:hypothetical protein